MAKSQEDFINTMKLKGYRINPNYVENETWEQEGNNILIRIRMTSFSRIIRFDSGSLGHLESLSFKKHYALDMR